MTEGSEPRHPSGVARRPDRAGIGIGLFLLILAAVLVWDAARLPPATGYSGMGPADTPRVVALGLALLGLWTMWEAFRAPAGPAPAQDVPPLLWIVGGLALQLVLVKSAGFSIAGGLLFACTAAAFGRRTLWVTIPIGIAVALAVFGVFGLLLDLSLPPGPLERLVFRL